MSAVSVHRPETFFHTNWNASPTVHMFSPLPEIRVHLLSGVVINSSWMKNCSDVAVAFENANICQTLSSKFESKDEESKCRPGRTAEKDFA